MKYALLLAAALVGLTAAAHAETAQELVAAADSARNPDQPFRLTDTLIEYIAGKPHDRVVLVIFAKEDGTTRQFNNLVRYAEPPRDSGKLVLLNGSNLWFYDPASKASVRISPQQRLLGQASTGDVLTVNLARDYDARLVGQEKLQDADRQDRDTWHLDLTAATPDAIYARIEYWIERGSNRSVKGKFYSDSGRLLKIAYYRKFVTALGGERPSETIIVDAVDASRVTSITSSDYRYQTIPDSWFQRDFLPRLKVE